MHAVANNVPCCSSIVLVLWKLLRSLWKAWNSTASVMLARTPAAMCDGQCVPGVRSRYVAGSTYKLRRSSLFDSIIGSTGCRCVKEAHFDC